MAPPTSQTQDHSTRRAFRLGLVSVLPTLIVLAMAIPVLWERDQSRLPCPLYPNAVVAMGAGLHGLCPLDYGVRIEAVSRGGEVHTVESAREIEAIIGDRPGGPYVLQLDSSSNRAQPIESRSINSLGSPVGLAAALVLCGFMLSIVLLTAVRARVPAALPFALLYGSVAALVAASTAGWAATSSYPWVALFRAILPAATIDLAMVFPRHRSSATAIPTLRVLPYLVFGLLWLGELDATYRGDHSTMLLVQQVVAAAWAVGAGVLGLSCIMATRASAPLIERRQARVFLKGSLGLGAATLLLWSLDPPGGIGSAATIAAALSPLPLGYAIARYHLFDLDLTVRRAASKLVYLLALTAILFVPLIALRESLPLPEPIQPPPVLFASLLGLTAVFELARRWVARSVETVFRPMGLEWESRLPNAGFRGTTPIENRCRELGLRLSRGLGKCDVSIFSVREGRFALLYASGPKACADSRLAKTASRLFPAGPADLNRVELDEQGEELYATGVEASCPVRVEDESLGWILVSPPRRGMFFSSGHLGFIAAAAAEAASVMHSTRLSEALSIADQFAAKGRVHAELAHEIGKPLGTLEVLATRLANRALPDSARETAVSSIARLAKQLRGIVRGVLEGGPIPSESLPVQVPDLVERALREIAEIRGEGRVVVHPLPNSIGLPVGAHALVRALTNLLDNAIQASSADQVCELRVREDGETVVFEVEDSGVGIRGEHLATVMDPFVTHREGGSGLGLSIAREVAKALRGDLELESKYGQGTCARIRIPLREDP